MCGISALFGPESALAGIVPMSGLVKHRGPDDEGYVLIGPGSKAVCYGGKDTPAAAYGESYPYAPSKPFSGQVPAGAFCALGHRRLSIIDVSAAGHQPMCYGQGRYWITFNGEVYNYIELREELEKEGYSFLSGTDTEVILASYMRWGKECLHRFNGMWAFVIVDTLERKLFVARDRFGVKPLYYMTFPGGMLALASEIKQFSCLPGWDPRINGPRAYDYLQFSLIDHTSETLFKGVYQLRGGEAIEISLDEAGRNDKPRVYRWYRLTPSSYKGTFIEARNEIRRLLKDAVRLRLRADVPVGSCLSGGLDSSAIVCLANDIIKDGGNGVTQKTFSACYEEKRLDERVYVDTIVNSRGLKAYYTYPSSEEMLAIVNDIVWQQDEPTLTTSMYAQWCVFRLPASEGVKVMLDGQGSDEILAGYPDFFDREHYHYLKRLKLRSLIRGISVSKKMHGRKRRDAIKRLAFEAFKDAAPTQAVWLGLKMLRYPRWVNVEKLGLTSHGVFHPKGDTIMELSKDTLLYNSIPALLHWEDRNSMAHSIESRVPFLDYRLVEFVYGLPDEYKIGNGITKYVLRESMRDIIPDKIIDRKDKMGFGTPEEHWARVEAPDEFMRLARESVNASCGVLNEHALKKVEHMVKGKEPYSSMAWRVIAFGIWIRRFGLRA